MTLQNFSWRRWLTALLVALGFVAQASRPFVFDPPKTVAGKN